MTSKIKTISYAELVNALLAGLPNREREVLKKRNALGDSPRYTLEQIGKDFNITRERVRQIEKEGLKKIKTLDSAKARLPMIDIESAVVEYLRNHGGVMSENYLIEKLLQENKEQEQRALNFLLVNILADKFERIDNLADYFTVWKLEQVNLDEILDLSGSLKSLIEKNSRPLSLDELLNQFQSHEYYEKVDRAEAENQLILEALLRLRTDLNKNILGQWGLINWPTIRPKRMTDKAYLIMLRESRPLHFSEVAELINQADFDRKRAHPATVHNELILDEKYVLVGRGIYALREWGYEEGTVADIIEKILKEKGPMLKKDLLEEVLKQRLVQRTTINLVLMNKDKFVRMEDGIYSLV
ncbi:MAG TPA: hypothetical protein ENN28_01395 [Candidatus Uhrbacteria bacterium]|nr:hypothetical protein [Candidatus Uhrbacteria bacterium]